MCADTEAGAKPTTTVTPEMADAGYHAFVLACAPSWNVCEVSRDDLIQVYIAMRSVALETLSRERRKTSAGEKRTT